MKKSFLFFGLFFLLPLHAYIKEQPTSIKKYTNKIVLQHHTSGIPPIDCIYVINLDERREKWAKMESKLSKHRLKGNRVSGVNGWKLSKTTLSELSGPYEIKMNNGHYGCLLSHVSILFDAYARGFSKIWILEDDAEFIYKVSLIPLLINELEAIDPNWDILFTDQDFRDRKGGYIRSLATNPRPDQSIYEPSYYVQRSDVSARLMRIHSRYGTHSMILSQRGIEKMLHYFSHVYVWAPIDIDMHYIPGLKEYASKKDIVSNSLEKNVSDTSKGSDLNSP